jgi:hypothetical protein
MTEMPRVEESRRDRIVGYALGMAVESAWILGWCLLAYLMAIAALAVLR